MLERAGLISKGKDTQRRPRKLEAKALEAAAEWIGSFEQFWSKSFDNLEQLQIEKQGDREIVMTRAFRAPKEKVFEADTTPEMLRQGFGAWGDWTMPV